MAVKIFEQLNIPRLCRKYGLALWQCPNFLFLIMGCFIIFASISSYLLGNFFITDPTLVALIDIILTGILFIIAVTIVKNFEKVAEASRMKSEFVNIVSHQLRGPITNIKWISEFIDVRGIEVPEEKRAEYVENLKENVGRIGELIDDLLIVSRLEEGTFPIRRKDFSLLEIAKEIVSRYKVFAEALNIEIKMENSRGACNIYFDSELVKLVIENLVDNAIRYTKPGGEVKIRIKSDGKNVRVEVKDNGVGIPDEEKKFIFQKFFRADNRMKAKTKGSGLGLYIAKNVIEAANGKIGFESEEGRGTTFYFTIPASSINSKK